MEHETRSWSLIDPAVPAAPTDDRTMRPGSAAIALAVAILGVALIAFAALGSVGGAGSGAGAGVRLPSAAAASGGVADATIVVEVVGAVRRPGLVHLAADSRVADAIAAAGGFSADVDAMAAAATLRLAKPVADGEQVRVPARGDVPSQGPVPGGAAPGPVDLNHATEGELDALPGIGPVTAGKIIAARNERPFTSVDELRERKIVGQATLEKLRDLVVVR